MKKLNHQQFIEQTAKETDLKYISSIVRILGMFIMTLPQIWVK